jgi:hypothetical protein
MKFLLLKTLLLHKQKDQGFTLPIVIAIGLVMVLLSAIDLVQSGEENLNALSQRGSADALAVAELGIARYRDLLINNRILAVNNSDQWISTNTVISEQVCTTGIFGTGGWADNSSTGWRDLIVNGNDLGEYKLVYYEYDRDRTFGDADRNGIPDDSDNLQFSQNSDIGQPDPKTGVIPNFNAATNNHNDTNNDGTSDAQGFLVVQGRDGTGSIAQLQVQIPMGVNTQDLEDLDPALWIQQSTPTSIGNIDIDSDGDQIFSESIAAGDNSDDGSIVLHQPSASGSNGCNDPTDLSQEITTSDPRTLPPLININQAGLTKRLLIDNISLNTGGTTANYFVGNKIVLGNSQDNTGANQALHTDGRYYYHTGTSTSDNLNLGAGEAIIADGTSKVILYVEGNLNINTGVAGQRTRLVNSSHRTEVNPTATVAEIRATTPSDIGRYLEIHVNGNVNITGNGQLFITGLLRANGAVNILGGSTVEVKGSIWANQWNNTSTGTVSITTDDYKFFSITPNRTPAPLTYRPSQWEKQEVY